MMKKIIGVVVIVIVIVLWNPFTLLPKSGPVWADDSYLIARTNDGFSLIYPADYYRYVFFPFRKLTKNDRIWKNAVDCKGNGNKLLLVYITEETEHDLVLRIIDPEKNQKIVLAKSVPKDIQRDAYPRLWISPHYYWVEAGRVLYRIEQAAEKVGVEKVSDLQPLLSINNDTGVFQQEFSGERILSKRIRPEEKILGWGIQGDSIITDDGKTTASVELITGKRTGVIRPSYGRMKINGNMGNLMLFEFIHESGEVPLFDPRLWVKSFIYRLNFFYYRPYLLDIKENKYFEMPLEVQKICRSKNDFITGYSGTVDMEAMDKIAEKN